MLRVLTPRTHGTLAGWQHTVGEALERGGTGVFGGCVCRRVLTTSKGVTVESLQDEKASRCDGNHTGQRSHGRASRRSDQLCVQGVHGAADGGGSAGGKKRGVLDWIGKTRKSKTAVTAETDRRSLSDKQMISARGVPHTDSLSSQDPHLVLHPAYSPAESLEVLNAKTKTRIDASWSPWVSRRKPTSTR